ncbi:MAG: hypothetical protein R3315_02030 [Woeseiaceae bacterium]|nr:hypothetical protein [Woeseiaceae bacterium]
MPEDVAARLKAHFADCAYCSSRLAEIVRASDARTGPARESATVGIRSDLRAIAAAAVVAVVAITAFWQQPGDLITFDDDTELRAVREPQTVPSLIFPADGQRVGSADMTVRWTPVADAIHYSVRIVDDYGRIIVDSFADTAEFTVPPHVRLEPNVTYYVKIDAYVVGDKAVSSSHIPFTVAE